MSRVINRYTNARRSIPVLAANKAKNHFLKSFRLQGFTDRYIEPWPSRKRSEKNKRRRALLVKSGALRRSISVRKATFKEIAVGSYGIRYSQVHNRGLQTKYFKMPKREFIGSSHVLTMEIRKIIKDKIRGLFR